MVIVICCNKLTIYKIASRGTTKMAIQRNML